MKLLFILLFILLALISGAQSLDGTYVGNEPRQYQIDDFGYVNFSPPALYPWYFEVKVIIKGERIDLYKRYAYTDSFARKQYADSLTNTYHYAARLIKAEDRYLAKSKLVNNPAGFIYINGKYTKEANIYNNPEIVRTTKEDQNLYRLYRYSDGRFTVAKEQIEQDLVIRPDATGIWLNNKFYKKVK